VELTEVDFAKLEDAYASLENPSLINRPPFDIAALLPGRKFQIVNFHVNYRHPFISSQCVRCINKTDGDAEFFG